MRILGGRGGGGAKANATGRREKLLWKQQEDNGKVNFSLVMAATGHLAEEEDFKHILFHSCIAKQHAQTSTVLAQNGNNEENVCVVGEKAVGDTDLINVKKEYYKQAPFASFSVLQLYMLKWSLGRNIDIRIPDSLCLALHASPG